MATNLRLDPRAVAALREAARRSGRSQQELLREAVDRFLGLDREPRDRERAVTVGIVKAPTPFDDVMPTITLPRGERTLDLLDRDSAR